MTIDYNPEKPNHGFGPLVPYKDACDAAVREANAELRKRVQYLERQVTALEDRLIELGQEEA